MLKKLLLGSALLAQAALPAIAQTRVCATPDPHTLPAAEQAVLQQIERHTQQFIAQQTVSGTANRISATLYTIPVVVHVLYNTAAQNISDAQIQSQIDVLNKDFSRTNTDAGNTPSAFQGVAADMQIRFVLATRDPSGNATTGIIRKSTTRTYFEYGGADPNGVFVKQNANGGSTAWNTSQYLNMWVCNFGGASSSLLGYATFPSDAGTTRDGVVMGYKYFGVNPSLGGVFGYGRTATHEVGHWMNLRHIWGDANCGNDLVSDTPTQQADNNGCPTFPRRTCGNTTNGDQFMNYMDYVNDQCMNMFSNGQKSRAHALFQTGGVRTSLLTSPGLGSGTTTCGVPASLSNSAITASGATLSWGAVSGASSYNLQYRVSGATTWTTVATTTTSRALTGLAAATTYQFQVQTVCASGSSGYSSTSTFATTSGGTTTPPAPTTYCASKGNSIVDEWIDFVQLGAISRTSGADAGYFNGTALSTGLPKGSSQTITYSTGYSGTAYAEVWNVWIDYNRDGDFIDAGEQVVSGRANTGATNLSSTFTVPNTASTGLTRMRVSMKYNATATSCETFSYGEVEDYLVNLGSTSARRDAGITAASFELSVYPNPAQGAATLRFTLPETGTATVTVYDLQGRRVATQHLAEQAAGIVEHVLPTLPAGMYQIGVSTASGAAHSTRLVVTQ